MTTPESIRDIFARTADQLAAPNAWCQNVDHNGSGAASLRGALLDQAGEHFAIAIASFAMQCREEPLSFNDRFNQDQENVVLALRSAEPRIDWRNADLRTADLRYLDLSFMDLSGSDLRHVDLSGADMRCSNVSGADMRCSNVRGVDLSSTNLDGANLTGCEWDEATVWPAGFVPARSAG